MLRTLFSPRLVGLHLLVVGVLVSFFVLGRWQLGEFESSGMPKAAADPAPVAVTELAKLDGHTGSDVAGRLVTAQGTFDADRQLLVADREADVSAPGGRVASGRGFWLLTPLRLADGTIIPIVRGWVPSATDPAVAVPQGTVTVTGRLRPAEQTDAVQRTGALPAGQVATVSTSELINLWTDGKLRSGFVVATAQEPAATAKPVAVPAPTVGSGLTWRNLAYAAQWWIFAAFAVFMWYHFVRDALRRSREERAAGGAASGSADERAQGPAQGPADGPAPVADIV
ncbi:SURF1 family protein [Microtetraspora sp. NBRC 16547]|uniref:SURF1 family protein n=1 Tax=Microtetraspora sp. NBRC 16547 TaxID=3030993 RepID=UPI0024A5C186|nr:SURF1 family protein [Microtetraspora sp. NBRC 16547]GLX03014.1 SURF1-like protein [Microtetraspora sp. NBRC 16547]